MEPKSLLSRISSNTTIPSVQSTNKFLSLSLIRSQNLVCFRTQEFLAPKIVLSYRRLDVIRSVENVKNVVTDEKNEEKDGIKKKKLAVFVSGGGSNFRSIHAACVGGSVHGDVVVLVTNKHDCGGAVYARDNDIPVILFPKSEDEPNGLSPNDVVAALRKFEVDFILLAGYLKLIPVELVRAYPKSMVNIHPSLLPAFGGKGYYGMNVHKAVIASGARYSGPTVHFVDEHYDTGRILAQKTVPVLWNDTAEVLAARVLQEEHQLYVDVVAALCEERVVWRKDGVPLIQSKENPDEYS
ncbi:phosphoribosylglycinamide formyltransferase, chloroplastic-like [Melia azedarach]|uniref:Phosphoribosylglycinamide formyltransferase, chloroplastic-like n=1 Tax=Melia azedarach TaxID=155640 RepID=A0ACC1XQH7_MELAZ|nr:phosphoribosylglycinamide formyltransferase, chloroplastic-like [Melia azedarach]